MSSPADAMAEPPDSLLASAVRAGQAHWVTSADKWPAGLARQRPRVPQGAIGVLVGGGFGALLGAMLTDRERDLNANVAIGAVAGGVVGGVAGAMGNNGVSRPLSLEQSLRIALGKLGASFVSLRYYGRYEARLVFEISNGFKVAVANADPNRVWVREDLDDWLYVALISAALSKLEVTL
jgi:hypothetical protein